MSASGFTELAAWMSAHGEGLRAFALRAGIDKSALWRLLHGHLQECSVRLADKLAAATGGEIGIDQVRAYEARQRRAQRV